MILRSRFRQNRYRRKAKAIADERGIHYEDEHKRGDIINLFFEECAEDKLIQPTFIYDYLEISPSQRGLNMTRVLPNVLKSSSTDGVGNAQSSMTLSTRFIERQEEMYRR